MYKKDITISILGPVGDVVEKWTLKGAWMVNPNFGDLSWEEGASPIEITISLRFDAAVLEF